MRGYRATIDMHVLRDGGAGQVQRTEAIPSGAEFRAHPITASRNRGAGRKSKCSVRTVQIFSMTGLTP